MTEAPQHIGIAACTAEGAALCYRTICVEGAKLLGPYAHPEVSLHGFSLADYMVHFGRSDWQGVAKLMLGSAEKLATMGADFLICPANLPHEAMPFVQPRSPLPWLHIADVVAAEAVERGFKCLAITGTRALAESAIYPERLAACGLECLRPSPAERAECNRIIFEELIRSIFKPESVATLQRMIARLKDEGAEAVILGCTEFPLVLNDGNSPLPILDSTRLLARAALRRAIEGVASARI
jgi:aspartate racemase